MTSTQIRQSFLDFFKSKQHTIVPYLYAAYEMLFQYAFREIKTSTRIRLDDSDIFGTTIKSKMPIPRHDTNPI
jgi:hypothetical protein